MIPTAIDSLQIEENVCLAPFTTLKVGGDARYFVRVRTEGELVEAVNHAERNGLALFILGGGSNILVADTGFDGLVVRIELSGIERTTPSAEAAATPPFEGGELTVHAGEDWDSFVKSCIEQDLAGIECMSGIPGLVGGTPVQNVGAYGQEVSETIVSVRCFDRDAHRIVTLSNDECGFSYRTSIFNSTERDRYVVLSVSYRLEKGGAPKIVYKDLKEYFADRQPTLTETRDAVINIRKAKSMVIDPNDPNSRSAGSFFKNPVVEKNLFDEIRSKFELVPSFPFGEKIKIPAAWLIENAGFYKGFRHERAGTSTNHSLALINCGGATAAEIVELKNLIQAGVEEKFGIYLIPEPVFVGFPQKF